MHLTILSLQVLFNWIQIKDEDDWTVRSLLGDTTFGGYLSAGF